MATQGGTLLQMLRGLDQQEIRAIRRRADWCNIEPYDTHQSFTKRLRDSIDRAVDQGELTYPEFIQFLRDEVIRPGPNLLETRIRQALENLPLSDSPIGKERKDEEWFSAQLYGALQNEFADQFDIFLEYELDPYSRERADLFMHSKNGEKTYLFESKVARSLQGGIKRTEGQLERYHGKLPNRDRTFVFIVGRVDDEKYVTADDSQRELSNYTDIPAGFDRIGELPKTTIVRRVLGESS